MWKIWITEQYKRDQTEEELFGDLEIDNEFAGKTWNRSRDLSTDSTEEISSTFLSYKDGTLITQYHKT
jgi:hypothetical protein